MATGRQHTSGSTITLKRVEGSGGQAQAPPAGPGAGGTGTDASPESPNPTDELLGQVVDGRYLLIRPLATGGMGSVYQAEQVNLKRTVALKIMVTFDADVLERFRREAVALCDVTHPAIVEIHDFTTFGEGKNVRGCLVMAYIDGKDLADYLDDHPQGRISPDETRILMLPIVSALVELHANGIIHRDIKPDNIVRFMRADGRPGVKLVDFGIARRQVDQGMTAAGYVLGTPPYLPPETMLGERHTPLSDIYALGATMFELLTGEPPYGRDSAGEIMQRALSGDPVFPLDLRGTEMAGLLHQMLDKVPSNRPDALQVLHALESMGRSARPRPQGEHKPQGRPATQPGIAPAPGQNRAPAAAATAGEPGSVPGSVMALDKRPPRASRRFAGLAFLAGAVVGAGLIWIIMQMV